jgi:Tfp pilus assembly protein PilN
MQQINLLQDVLIDKPQPFHARQLFGLFAVIALVLLLVVFVRYRQMLELQTELTQLEQEKIQTSERVAQLELLYPQPQKDALLEQKVAHLEQELVWLKEALSLVENAQVQGNGVLLGSLERLAQYPLSGVWLRSIRVGRNSADIRLQGSALKAELVPEYMQLLRDEHVLGGQLFTELSVSRMPEESGYQVDFELFGGAEEKQ